MKHSLKTGLLSAALIGAIGGAAMVSGSDTAEAAEGKIKCYGVAKAGQNDCGAADGSHACAGQAKTDNDPNEWKFATAQECEAMHGSTTPKLPAANAEAGHDNKTNSSH